MLNTQKFAGPLEPGAEPDSALRFIDNGTYPDHTPTSLFRFARWAWPWLLILLALLIDIYFQSLTEGSRTTPTWEEVYGSDATL